MKAMIGGVARHDMVSVDGPASKPIADGIAAPAAYCSRRPAESHSAAPEPAKNWFDGSR